MTRSKLAHSTDVLDRQSVAAMSTTKLLEQLECSVLGLRADQVIQRRAQYGVNALRKDGTTALRVLIRQFQSALIYFLMVAAILAFATRDISDGVIITIILIVNASLGFIQEYRSERAVEKLALLISDKVLVRRDSSSAFVEVTELVPGDIVVLKEGDIVPADIKLLVADSVQVDESQLTGESVPVSKAVRLDDLSDAGTDGNLSLLFTGSTVDSGELTGVVYAIANETALGKIAALSTSIRKVTQYEKSLRAFSTLLIKIIGSALAVTLAIKIALGGGAHHISELLLFVIALAVAVIPEALPVIATLTLSHGALKLAKEKVVVKRLSSLEDLGNVTILCTDKTGTLTEGRVTIQRLVSTDDRLFQTLAYAAIDRNGTGTQTSFDLAFDSYVSEDIKIQAGSYAIAGEIPFDPADRRRRVVLSTSVAGLRWLVVIGSAETLFDIADCPARHQYVEQIVAEGQQGMRHLALAYRQLTTADSGDIMSLERNLTFLGFVTMSDPLRAGIRETIATARELGVTVKMLTGDSTEVAAYVAREVGLLPDGGSVYSGDDLNRLSPAEFMRVVTETNVFARVPPEQKYAIIEALQVHDVVGYQGDGINDAPSLKLADVGIAVDTATEVAKASADIMLLERDLGVIVNAVRYGRITFANINKYIKYTMVGNFGNFFALAVLYLLATELPLLPRQILLVSLLTDLPLVAISSDTVDRADLEQPDKYDPRALLSISLVLGSLTALAELTFFLTLHGKSTSVSEANLYLFLSFTQLMVILSIRNRKHFWRAQRPSGPLLGAMALTALVAVAIPFVQPVAQLFSFGAPSPADVGLILLAATAYLLVLDTLKVWYFRLSSRSVQYK